jgi:hypothetical protein
MKRFGHIFVLMCFVVLAPGILIAQVPEPPPAVLGSGGGSSSDGTNYLSDTIGQAVIGEFTASGQRHFAGFWYLPDRLHIGPTSSVLIASFKTAIGDRGVELSWMVASSDDLRGFNVYRALDSEEGFIRLNGETLVPAGQTIFVDSDIRPNQAYRYRLGAVDSDGEFFSAVSEVTTPRRELELYQNYPNPFNPMTHIDFYLPSNERVSLTVYDVRGKRVATLIDQRQEYGHHSVTWDGTDLNGERVGSGVYFYRLEAGKRVITKKLVVVK